jgi:ubiquinone/menaquinone biosynthesis C-methylase UbiE
MLMRKMRSLFLTKDQTCPWWLIGSFDNPLRRLIHQPEHILGGLVKEGQTVLDIGPGMGYFTIPMADMVGENGIVIAADLQPQMLAGLRRRAEKAGLSARIQLHLSQPDRIGVTTPPDFILAFWMLHEVRYPEAFLAEVYRLLKPGGCMLLVEPIIHVSGKQFEREVQTAIRTGFGSNTVPSIRFSRAALLTKTIHS